MTDRERLENIRRLATSYEKYLTTMSKAPSTDFWRGYETAIQNFLGQLVEELDEKKKNND